MSNFDVVRMPAEWEPHAGCFMGWPGNAESWSADLALVRRDYAAVAHAISRFEKLTMLVNPADLAGARDQLGSGIELLPVPLNEPWLRDSGPSFVKGADGKVAAVTWRFNGWGEYSPDFSLDALVGRGSARHLNVPVVNSALAMEGGALHVDGRGTLLTTETVVFNRNRNPGITRETAEAEFARTLGITKTIWLPGNPYEKGTDGHIDGIACFVRPGVVLFETSASGRAEMRTVTEKNQRALAGQTDAEGRALQFLYVQEAPDTGRGTAQGWGYSTSYVNFYIANGAVITPSFGVKEDAAAKEAIMAAFPDREVVQVDISTIASGGGGIHCITQQLPA